MITPGQKNARLFAVDALRVFAILMMIAYHFIYDLKYFGYVDWNTPLGNGFRQWRTSIVFGFVLTMGVSMGLAHSRKRHNYRFLVRLFQISICAAVITAMSLILFPKSWIYFGILHFMALASILTFALVGRPYLAICLGMVILTTYLAGIVPYGWPFMFIPSLPSYTEDFVSPFPWLGVAFIGLGIGGLFVSHSAKMKRLAEWELRGTVGTIVNFAGKRSLSIYMTHQPLLFAAFITFGALK